MPSVLFVCTANICRSPMAVALFRAKLASLDQAELVPEEAWRVESAGTWGMDECEMAEGVKIVLDEMGINPGEHTARTVNAEMLDSFDLILTMEKGQKEALQLEFSEVSKRVYLLSEMIGERFDIRDPMGGPLENYRKTAGIISMILDQGFNRIQQLVSARK